MLFRLMDSFNSSERPRTISSPLWDLQEHQSTCYICPRSSSNIPTSSPSGHQSAGVAAEEIATMTRSGILAAAAARLFRAIVHAVQVETHGQYSVERLRSLHDHISVRPTNNLSLAAALLVTPLPCLAVILLLEAIPLDSPSAGINANVGFLVQASAAITALTLFTITMYEAAVPTLRLRRIQVAAMTVGTTMGMFVSCYASALAIGFPVPFLMTLTTPVFVGQLALYLFVSSVSHLRVCPSARASAKDWIKVFMLMGSTMMVYPICNYAFEKASTQGQIAVSLLMGCIKVAYKYTMGKFIRENGDLRAEIVNFHSEVPNALFVAFSMQNANSMLTIAMFLAIDVLHACTIIYDAHLMGRTIARLEKRCRGTPRRSNTTDSDPGEDKPEVSLPRPPEGTMIDRALAIVSRRTEEPRAMLPLSSTARSLARPSSVSDTNTPFGWCKRLCVRKLKKIVPGPPAIFDHRILTQVVARQTPPTKQPTTRRSKPSTPPSAAENEFADAVLRLLYMTEFVVLAEMIEMVVPVIYGEALQHPQLLRCRRDARLH